MQFKKVFFLLFIFFFVASCKKDKTGQEKFNIAKPEINDTININPNIFSYDYDTSLWTEIINDTNGIILDLRYATTNNFVNKILYNCPRCFLRPEAANAIFNIQKELSTKNLRLKLFDCYRPGTVQQRLWEIIPDPRYVANPKKGSMHNRGLAVDLTILDENNNELDMGTGFDFFGEQAYHTYLNLDKNILDNRTLLKNSLIKYGFQSIRTEWWHYSYNSKSYPLSQWEWECPSKNQ